MQLYIHLPFCKSKCAYCDFNSYVCHDDTRVLRYLTALNKEIALAGEQYDRAKIDTVYFGGGTPSILSGEQFELFAENLLKSFDLSDVSEFTVECNPESITDEKLLTYKRFGVNRLSVGVQSLSDENLKSVGRLHTSSQALAALELASRRFDNLSCDFIVGLPFDSAKIVADEIKRVSKYVKHVSVYELTLEEGTALFKRVADGKVKLPDDDEIRDLFEIAVDELDSLGFSRYEVSNFAKDGYYSRHNYGYWTREEYLGLGAGASSFVKTADGVNALEMQTRYANVRSIDKYVSALENANAYADILKEQIEYLSKKDERNEQIMLGLRTTKGVRRELLGSLPKRLQAFFECDGDYCALTREGLAVMNSILVEILEDF